MNRFVRLGAIVLACSALAGFGCSANLPSNPSFALTVADAKADLRAMRDDPAPLERPLIIAGGYIDPGPMSSHMKRRIKDAFSNQDQILRVSFPTCVTFDACADHLARRVDKHFPSDDPNETVEVDVIGLSMGGLVARYAALPERETKGKRLRIRRLFTVASPQQGANIAVLWPLDPRQRAMTKHGDVMERLDDAFAEADYELIPYVRLTDTIVGTYNCAPPGVQPWWLANRPFSFAHLNAHRDQRFQADMARRLRGDEPHTTSPPAPWPEPEPRDPQAWDGGVRSHVWME